MYAVPGTPGTPELEWKEKAAQNAEPYSESAWYYLFHGAPFKPSYWDYLFDWNNSLGRDAADSWLFWGKWISGTIGVVAGVAAGGLWVTGAAAGAMTMSELLAIEVFWISNGTLGGKALYTFYTVSNILWSPISAIGAGIGFGQYYVRPVAAAGATALWYYWPAITTALLNFADDAVDPLSRSWLSIVGPAYKVMKELRNELDDRRKELEYE